MFSPRRRMASLEPVDEVVPTVLVPPEPVAGVEPEVAEGLGRLVGHGEVALAGGPRISTSDHQLSDLADRYLLVGIRIDEPDVEPSGVEQPGGARRSVDAVGRQDGHARLGQAEDLHESLDAETALERVDDRAGGGRGEDAAELVVGVVGPRFLLPHEVHHHADELVTVAPAALTWSIHSDALNRRWST